MYRSKLLHCLTALALLLGQWSMLAHASEHSLETEHEGPCIACVQGHSLEQMQTGASYGFSLGINEYSDFLVAAAALLESASHQPLIRGPPQLL